MIDDHSLDLALSGAYSSVRSLDLSRLRSWSSKAEAPNYQPVLAKSRLIQRFERRAKHEWLMEQNRSKGGEVERSSETKTSDGALRGSAFGVRGGGEGRQLRMLNGAAPCAGQPLPTYDKQIATRRFYSTMGKQGQRRGVGGFANRQ